ncbi:MAG TPA: hypothetical protein VEX68_08810 [Bryobacteraceae bacterium]|nr:hypothetical protein [Bryobacteraceae bacterium]
MVIFIFLFAVAVAASVTRIVKLDVPTAVGVPAMPPVEAFKVRPAGNEPVATDHVRGAVPPLATSVVE